MNINLQALSTIRNPIQQDEVTVTFYITEDGSTVVATDVSEVFEELGIAKTSAELGLEVGRSFFYYHYYQSLLLFYGI